MLVQSLLTLSKVFLAFPIFVCHMGIMEAKESSYLQQQRSQPKHYQFDNYASNGVCALCYSAKVQQPNGNQTNQMGKAKHGLGQAQY